MEVTLNLGRRSRDAIRRLWTKIESDHDLGVFSDAARQLVYDCFIMQVEELISYIMNGSYNMHRYRALLDITGPLVFAEGAYIELSPQDLQELAEDGSRLAAGMLETIDDEDDPYGPNDLSPVTVAWMVQECLPHFDAYAEIENVITADLYRLGLYDVDCDVTVRRGGATLTLTGITREKLRGIGPRYKKAGQR